MAFPGRDFELRNRDFFLDTDWRRAPGVMLEHARPATLSATIPVTDPAWCTPLFLAISATGVRNLGGGPAAQGIAVGTAARRFEITLPDDLSRPVDVILVVLGYSRASEGRAQSRWAIVSDPLRLVAPPG